MNQEKNTTNNVISSNKNYTTQADCSIKKTPDEKALLKERIENGDIFLHCEHKGKCKHCGAVTDADNDKYCWKCGKKLDNTEIL